MVKLWLLFAIAPIAVSGPAFTAAHAADLSENPDGSARPATLPDSKTSTLPLGSPATVDYAYHHLSYSAGIDFRIAEPFAVFGRYSRGERAATDRILFTPAVNYVSGALLDQTSAFDTVTQTEGGLKFREQGMTLNITGFSATTGEHTQIGPNVSEATVRSYSARGAAVEAGVRHGPFGLTAGATYTKAKLTADPLHPEMACDMPHYQANLVFATALQVQTKYVNFGTSVIGTSDSFARDENALKLPGYALVNAFVQLRKVMGVDVMLNVNNLFDKLALADINASTNPTNGIVRGRANIGRTLAATLQYVF